MEIRINGRFIQGELIAEFAKQPQQRESAVNKLFLKAAPREVFLALAGRGEWDELIWEISSAPPRAVPMALRKIDSRARELRNSSREADELEICNEVLHACASDYVESSLRSENHERYPFHLGHLDFFETLSLGIKRHHECFLSLSELVRFKIEEQFLVAGVMVPKRYALSNNVALQELRVSKTIIGEVFSELRWAVILDVLRSQSIEAFCDSYRTTLTTSLDTLEKTFLTPCDDDSIALVSSKSALITIVLPELLEMMQEFNDSVLIDYYLNAES